MSREDLARRLPVPEDAEAITTLTSRSTTSQTPLALPAFWVRPLCSLKAPPLPSEPCSPPRGAASRL